jgi:ADP-ribosylglycohydrolase
MDHVVGCILGTAVGDAIGLPYEGLSRRRAEKLLGRPANHRFFFGRGMISDDTEHTCMVAQSLIACGGDIDSFRRHLGWRFRFWLLGLPAGIGMATIRATLRLWIGFGPHKSGVYSAGNGPAMRSAILGAAIDDPQLLRAFVRASTRITHTDPKAEYGAFAIALAAQLARQSKTTTADHFVDQLQKSLGTNGEELITRIAEAARSSKQGQSTESFADSIGLARGVSGYVYHSVPIAIYAWFVHPHDFRSAVTSVIRCGGDTDSTAAMVGGIVGTAVGKNGIPSEWLDRLIEWPRSISWMEQLGARLDAGVLSDAKGRSIRLPVWGVLPRNLFFLLIVLCHGIRRLFPPY